MRSLLWAKTRKINNRLNYSELLIRRMGIIGVWIVAGQELPACRLMANQHRDADKRLHSHNNKKRAAANTIFCFWKLKKGVTRGPLNPNDSAHTLVCPFLRTIPKVISDYIRIANIRKDFLYPLNYSTLIE